MSKPVALYSEMYFCEQGKSALVLLFNPTPRVNDPGRTARTSRVQAYDPATGEFETLNTLYKPAPGAKIEPLG